MKKILKIFIAFLVSLTFFTPFNVGAYFTQGSTYQLNVYDHEGNVVQVCDFNNGIVGHGCGIVWDDIERGFGGFKLVVDKTIAKNYTVEIFAEFEISGINHFNGAFNTYFQYSYNGFTQLESLNHHGEKYHNHNMLITVSTDYTNNTNYDIDSIELGYLTYAENYIDYTLIKINQLSMNIYDEDGRLLQKIEDGVNLLHYDLSSNNSLLEHIWTEISFQAEETRSAIEWHFDNMLKEFTKHFTNLESWIQNQTNSINDKLESLLGSNSNYNDDLNDANDKNDELSQDVNDYNDLESGFHNSMNDSLDNIDLNVDLITGNDFITTATFISTNMNRIVTSNKFYESFVITGLILGLALVIIGKKVI